MPGAIFLSAGVPDPRRDPKYAATADIVAITSAVSSLVHVTLGRRPLIWGGHPAITPMIWVVADELMVDYGSWVKLYQSSHFREEFPEDNKRFGNLVITKDLGDRASSLRLMREQMLCENEFDGAVFVGGMEGVEEEFQLFQNTHPKLPVVPIGSSGGAAFTLAMKIKDQEFVENLDYVSLYHRHLNISVREVRYASQDKQPKDAAARLWVNPALSQDP